jgi:phosphatidylglycerophosphate synthase
MLDAPLRKLIDPPLARMAAGLIALGVSADALTVAGFVLGLAALPDIATRHYWTGLALIFLSRLFDGLDGAVARRTRSTELGAYLDAALDFILDASVPFAFALADPGRALAALFLLFGFVASGSTFLAFAATRRGPAAGPVGLSDASQTTIAFALACVFPDWFGVVAYVLGVSCFVTAGARVAAAVARLGAP